MEAKKIGKNLLVILSFAIIFTSCGSREGLEERIIKTEKELKEIEELKNYYPEEWEKITKLMQEAKINNARRFKSKAKSKLEEIKKEIEMAKLKLKKAKEEEKEKMKETRKEETEKGITAPVPITPPIPQIQ
jgi:DNA repair exonuclease SbcCD ATPase subunit